MIVSPIRVLIIDDEQGMRRTLSRVLKAKGFEVETAENAEQGIKLAQETSPHCILLDVRMPGMSGVEAYRVLQKVSPDAFIVFMSAFCSEDLRESADLLGAVDFLSKPLDLDRLSQIIEANANSIPVLVVDDDENFCESLRRILHNRGCSVQIARNVETGRKLFSQRPRGVVILDLRMHVQIGHKVIEEYMEINRDVGVVMVSGQPELASQVCPEEYANQFPCLQKPIDVEQLLQIICTNP